MTPPEILLKFKATGSADFLSELEGEDLWGFLSTDRWDVMGIPMETYWYDMLHPLVVAELRREVAADLDIWINLERSDLKVKPEWIAELTDHRMIGSNISVVTIWEIIEYLKERQVK